MEKRKKPLLKTSRTTRNYVGITLMVIWSVFTICVIGWIVVASFSTTAEIFDNKLLSSGLHLENYITVVEKHNILKYFANSLIYTGLSCIGVIFLAAPAAYSLANFSFRGRKVIQTAYSSTMGIPGTMLMVPIYMMVSQLKLSGNLFVLVVIYIFSAVPFTMFFLTSFFATIPKDIQESALVEGCTHTKAFWKVIFPLAQPGIITVTIFNFIGTWNEYTWALIFANSSSRRTLALGLQSIVDGMRYSGNWASLFAAVVMVVLPTFILFILLSEKIMGGITSGAVKG